MLRLKCALITERYAVELNEDIRKSTTAFALRNNKIIDLLDFHLIKIFPILYG